MKVQEGKTINWTNSTGADVSDGDVVSLGSCIGVAVGDIAAGETGAIAIEEVYQLEKAAVAIVQGDRLYWDVSASALTTTAQDNIPAGIAVTAAASDATVVDVKLLPPVPAAEALTYTNGSGSDIAAGQAVLVGARLGVAVAAIADGAAGLLDMSGVRAVPKATGVIGQGAAVYWDADGDPVGGTEGSGALTTTSTDNTLAGYAWVAAASGDATVTIKLNG